MKYLGIFFITLFIVGLTACDDADDKVSRINAFAILHPGTQFILCNTDFEGVDTIFVKEFRILPGRVTIDSNPKNIGYSINEMDYEFKTFNRLKNIYFNFENQDLVWIASSSINSQFAFENMHKEHLDNHGLLLDFDGDSPLNIYGPKDPLNNIIIKGKITFTLK